MHCWCTLCVTQKQREKKCTSVLALIGSSAVVEGGWQDKTPTYKVALIKDNTH